jgi:hypothetical protein
VADLQGGLGGHVPGPGGPTKGPRKNTPGAKASRLKDSLGVGRKKLRGPGPAWAHSASPLRVEKNFRAVEVPQGTFFATKNSATLNLFSNLPLVHY